VRVLLVSGSLPPMRCGIGDYSLRLGQALAARPGVEVAILTSKGAAARSPAKPMKLFTVMDKWTWGERRAALNAIREWKPDVLHVQFPTQGYGAGDLPHLLPRMAHRLGIKVVRTFHEVATWGDMSSRRQLLGFFAQMLAPGPFVTVRPNYRDLLHPRLARLSRKRRWVHIQSASALPRAMMSTQEVRALRDKYLQSGERLITYFGFIHESKGADLLFDIADPSRDCLVFAGAFGEDAQYRDLLDARAHSPDWAGKVAFPGFLDPQDAAELLAVSDAVVLPYREGGGSWNTSILAAVEQGTPVVTTAMPGMEQRMDGRVAFAPIGDVAALKAELDRIASPPQDREPHAPEAGGWDAVAARHLDLYRETGVRS
jgi:glycosyltransferase involved in cell wall biosynthesis